MDEKQQARWNAVYGAAIAQLAIGELAMQQATQILSPSTGKEVSISRERMTELCTTARKIADGVLLVDP